MAYQLRKANPDKDQADVDQWTPRGQGLFRAIVARLTIGDGIGAFDVDVRRTLIDASRDLVKPLACRVCQEVVHGNGFVIFVRLVAQAGLATVALVFHGTPVTKTRVTRASTSSGSSSKKIIEST